MTRLRLSGRGVAYAASALIHGGVVWALLPSLTGSAAPTPAETPMAIEMAGFGTPAEQVDTAEPVETTQAEAVETAQAEPVEPVETVQPEPVEPTETVPPETVQDQPVETTVEEPPPPAETTVTEAAEVQPPEPAPETPPPELVTTTGETEAVVAAVPETVQAAEPEEAQPMVVQPPPARPKPPAERRPRREQPRRTEQPAETRPAPTQQVALPPRPVAQPPTSAGGGARSADYAAMLRGHLSQRIRRMASMVREPAVVTVTVTIELDGTISAAAISRSSGSDSVDREILRRVNGASPVPPPPTRIASQPLPFQIDPR